MLQVGLDANVVAIILYELHYCPLLITLFIKFQGQFQLNAIEVKKTLCKMKNYPFNSTIHHMYPHHELVCAFGVLVVRKGTCFLLDQSIQLNSRKVIQDIFTHQNYSSLIQKPLM